MERIRPTAAVRRQREGTAELAMLDPCSGPERTITSSRWCRFVSVRTYPENATVLPFGA